MSAEVQRDLVEFDLIERFGWTREEVLKTPYKWIQKFYIFQKAKEAGVQDRRGVNELKSNAGKPGGKRQIITDPKQIVASNKPTAQGPEKQITKPTNVNKGVKK